MTDNELPKVLENCPIVDSVVELRFESEIFPQAVFGVVYEKLKKKYPIAEALPITQLPPALIQADLNFKTKPHYLLRGSSKYVVQVGPEVVIISGGAPYEGWGKSFFPSIEEVINIVYETGVIKVVNRLGIRYTNFFPNQDVFNKVRVRIEMDGEQIPYKKTTLRTELTHSDFANTLQISNDATRQVPGGPKIVVQGGSLIDVDTFKNYSGNPIEKSDLLDDIQKGHKAEKFIFWNSLSAELQAELKPIY